MKTSVNIRSMVRKRNLYTQMTGQADNGLLVERILRGFALGLGMGAILVLYGLSWLPYLT